MHLFLAFKTNLDSFCNCVLFFECCVYSEEDPLVFCHYFHVLFDFSCGNATVVFCYYLGFCLSVERSTTEPCKHIIDVSCLYLFLQ